MEDINVKVLDEVNKGATMGMDAIDFLAPKVQDNRFKQVLDTEYNHIVECKSQEDFCSNLQKYQTASKNCALCDENILKEFNNFIESIPEETYKKERKRWKNIPGYGIEQIEEFLNVRIPYLDNIMNSIKQ